MFGKRKLKYLVVDNETGEFCVLIDPKSTECHINKKYGVIVGNDLTPDIFKKGIKNVITNAKIGNEG